MTMKPQIDVIIPVYQPKKEFGELLQKLLQQTVLPHHVYLLQTMEEGDELFFSDDDCVSVHPIRKKEFDHGATRDYGARLAMEKTGEGFLLYMTQDAVPVDETLLERLSAPFQDESTAIVYARQMPRKQADIVETLTRLHNYPEESMVKTKADLERLGIKTYFCSDVCAMYRKDIYFEMGGFVHPTIFNEDMIMASKVIQSGYQVVYCAEAQVIHSHSYTCMQQFHRNFDLGVSQKQYSEVFENISSEKEGAGYASSLLKYLLKRGKVGKAFYFALQCGFKLLGFRLGKQYDRLPGRVVSFCTMSPEYSLFVEKR
jgi:rhamnosyltransferase